MLWLYEAMVPIPFNEAYRLAALDSYRVLDSEPEPAFDRITRLTKATFDVPMVAISLIDPTRQWFKSSAGLEIRETAREHSFCGHAIVGSGPMQVADAMEDARFRASPLVLEPPKVRFYAGAPLVTPEGFQVGMLCLMDRKARAPLNAAQLDLLQDLAALVISELELRKARLDAVRTTAGGTLPGGAASERATGGQAPLAAARAPFGPIDSDAQLDVISSLAHEFRTPLTAILGFSEAIFQQLCGEIGKVKYLDYADNIHQSGRHLLALVDRILDYAKTKHGEIALVEDWVDLRALSDRCILMLSQPAARGGLELANAVSADLPRIKADGQQVLQMLINLVGNAVKFTNHGGRVRIASELLADGRLSLEVSDTGIGMSGPDIEQALLPFGQVDHDWARHHEGTGLGLPLTKRLIELHGGELRVDSRPGMGTRVSLIFPAYRLAPGETGLPARSRRAGPGSAPPAA